MRIAICDDEPIHRVQLKKTLRNYHDLPDNTNVAEYSSGEELLSGYTKEPFDIVFLDIEMDGISGLKTGQYLRKKDKDVIIIFLTSHAEYVFKSFDIEPFNYVMKSGKPERLNRVISNAIKKHNEQRDVVEVKWQDRVYALRICDIVYIESNAKKLTYATENNTYETIGKLNDHEQKLSPYGFLRCHQSILINMKFIKSIESTKIIINTVPSGSVDMSVRRKQACLDAFSKYIVKYKV